MKQSALGYDNAGSCGLDPRMSRWGCSTCCLIPPMSIEGAGAGSAMTREFANVASSSRRGRCSDLPISIREPRDGLTVTTVVVSTRIEIDDDRAALLASSTFVFDARCATGTKENRPGGS